MRDRTGQIRDRSSLRSALTNKRKLVERGLTFMILATYLAMPKLHPYLAMPKLHPESKMRCVRSTIVSFADMEKLPDSFTFMYVTDYN